VATTRRTAITPLDLLRCNEVALLKLSDFAANSDYGAGDLMSADDRAAKVVGKQHVSVAIRLEHMHVRAADPARCDSYDQLVWSGPFRIRNGRQRHSGLAPDLVRVNSPVLS